MSWCRGVKGVLGASRDSRYPGPEGVEGASRVLGAPRGCRKCQGCIGGWQGL